MDGQSKLIEELSGNLTPVKRLRMPVLRALICGSISILYLAGTIHLLGIRSDITIKISEPGFIFEILLMFTTAAAALLSAAVLCIPDLQRKNWLLPIPLTLGIVFTGWLISRGISEGLHMHVLNWKHCLIDAFVLGFIPATSIAFMTRSATTTKPFMLMVMNVLGITALAYIGLRFTCINDTLSHCCFYHILPFILAGTLFGIFAPRIYRW